MSPHRVLRTVAPHARRAPASGAGCAGSASVRGTLVAPVVACSRIRTRVHRPTGVGIVLGVVVNLLTRIPFRGNG